MHVCSSGSVLLVNAEVDSMGGVVDAGVRIGVPSSPQKASIEQAQAELRQKYDARAETKREIEFLEKGGDPLDLKIGNVASVSVQSTSLTDQHPETIVTSEAKGSFALTASPLGDSVESSGILGAPSVCEPNSADNLMLFDGDNEFRVLERKTVHPRRSNIAPSDHFSHLESSLNAKESGDSTAFELPKKAYKRRNRSRPNRDGARSSSTDTVPIRGGYNSLPSRHASRDAKGLIHDEEKQDRNLSSNSNSKPLSPEATMALKTVPSDSQIHMDMAGVQTVESTIGFAKGGPSSAASDSNASKILKDNQVNQLNESVALETPTNMVPREAVSAGIMEQVVLAGSDDLPSVVTQKVKDQAITGQINGFSNRKGDRKSILTGGQNSNARFTTKGLDSESSCTQTSLSLDGNNGSDVCTSLKNINSNGSNMDHTLASEEVPNVQGKEIHKEKFVSRADIVGAIPNDNSSSLRTNYHENGSMIRTEGETKGTGSPLLNQVDPITVEGVAPDNLTESLPEKKPSNSSIPNSTPHNENACTGRLQGSADSSTPGLLETTSRGGGSTAVTEQHTCLHNSLKLESKAHEDSVLEEARIIEAKRKRIAELSVGTLPLETRRKSHWDFVLEEMTWLANDFAQERLWKIAASAQVSRRVAFTSRLRFQKQISLQKQKEVAHTLAEAVLEFWRTVQDTSKELEVQCSEKDFALPLQKYAVKFLEYNGSFAQHGAAEAPKTPDRMTDLGTLDISWEDNLTEENLFYTVPSGAVEAYRKSIESHLLHFEKTGSSMQDEAETSAYDAAKDFGSQENMLEEDEGATSTYYLPGAIESSKSAIHAQKKRKMKAYNGRSYELGADYCMENKVGNQQAALIPKRPSNSHNVSIPTKRVRTASRQRVLSPFGAGTSGCVQAPGRADASSGDTNSFQDDQSTLHGGSQIPNSLEAESVGDFEKQLQYDSPEVSNRPKKKKKAKHLGPTYEQRWQLDSNFQNDQRDHLKRRLENHQFESNGRSGLFGQHIPKKPKMIKQSLDNSYDNLTAMGGSIPSPVASQMSNMSNPNKFIRMLGVRDRGRKNKALKTPAGQPGSGSPWSLFEDQALVVLVHDMGPNWELVSDAINSTLQFKCIFRKPKECKERHKILMDRTTGDGADSAEDSGSSQPYPSSLPGIPKGSARQLFQRLQGPMEEDTLKSHFEKIIIIGQKQHYRRIQNDNQDPKQLQQPHSSHALALSQVCPNNLNGVPVLTPLDLCDATAPSPDALPLGFQGAPISGLPTPNQGSVAPILPASGANSSIQGPSNMAPGSNFPSPSAPVNASIRDVRYNIPRTASLSADDQQRMLQYNQMLSGRNIQQNLPVSGAHPGADRGARVLSGANGLGIMGGMNRNMPRPGFQGIASPSMLTSGSGVVANMHSGAGPGQGNSMMRHRDALHMMRPNQNTEHQRQMSVPELQMQQASQGGTNQGAPPFVGGLSSSFPNQTVPPVQSYPLHHQQQTHPMSPQQSPHVLNNNSQHPHHLQATPNHTSNAQHSTAYAIRIAKERHLQQQRLLQQQQQFATSNASLPHGQPPVSQLPISSPQISSQIQPQTSPPISSSPMMTPSPSTPMSQHPTQKHHVPPAHGGLARNSQTGSNQMAKLQRQRQAQQFQQAGRQHPQQRQQAQQQAKLLKGAGRGAMIMHQNLPMDPSLVNGFSGSQSTAEKGEQQVVNHLMQGGQSGLYSGSSALNSAVQSTSKQSVPHSSSNQLHPQQQPYSGQAQAGSLKQLPQQMLSGSSGNSNSQTPAPPAIASSGAPSVVAPSNQQQQQQQQPHPKLVNQSQTEAMHRSIHQNRQKNSSELPLSKPQAGEAAHAEQQLGTVPQAHSTDAAASEIQPVVSASATQWKASESFFDSSGLVPNHATELGKSCLQPSPPSTNAAVTGSELPGPVVSQGVIQGQSSSDSLSNPVGHDVGVQWLQQQQSSS